MLIGSNMDELLSLFDEDNDTHLDDILSANRPDITDDQAVSWADYVFAHDDALDELAGLYDGCRPPLAAWIEDEIVSNIVAVLSDNQFVMEFMDELQESDRKRKGMMP